MYVRDGSAGEEPRKGGCPGHGTIPGQISSGRQENKNFLNLIYGPTL